ncbi:DNA alkylation repair protein [Limosilactobacillus agrestis]|uniref:DNA alkylation repair protein n=1 Tax=Limosilactobacillus agrestis TaxID=2759748 RepID=UPI001E44A6FA|nr:DNA alkylation repair protein [Limosilactobacillus agrestis]MCD7113354.1 DNA alkylation repair protein [Limosilactobacillus agrestis]
MNYQLLTQKFEQKQNPVRARQMEKYLRNQFICYGIQSKERRTIYHQKILADKKKANIDWQLLDAAWGDNHREQQYFVCDYLIALKQLLSYKDIVKIEKYVRSKQWWDTTDSLINPISYIGLQDHHVDQLMLKWSLDSDKWVRRVAIEYQLLRKERTNTQLLEQIIINNLDGQKEFFIDKAIGWVLRDFSKTDPNWVKNFIQLHHNTLSKLSLREASKYL